MRRPSFTFFHLLVLMGAVLGGMIARGYSERLGVVAKYAVWFLGTVLSLPVAMVLVVGLVLLMQRFGFTKGWLEHDQARFLQTVFPTSSTARASTENREPQPPQGPGKGGA